jgi:hypothetical protein
MSMAKLDNQSAATTPIEGGKKAISAEVSLTTGY